MSQERFRFEDFVLDPGDRRLVRAGAPVELNARYLDALALLVREQGRLVTRDRFLEEVWAGVPVGDEALTQAVRVLRRTLGDDISAPRFIETVPKHGYRFVAAVEQIGPLEAPGAARDARGGPGPWRDVWTPGAAGSAGGALAGLIGGIFYGFLLAGASPAPGMGAVSILLVLLVLTAAIGLIGGMGVSFAMAAARLVPAPAWLTMPAGGALGGLAVGALFKLVGLDALTLLFGDAPRAMTGAGEGAVLGAAAGLAGLVALGDTSLRRTLAAGSLAGALAGLAIHAAGGRLMGGSLDLLAQSFPGSRLNMDAAGALFGETGFGPASQAVTIALEGALFVACLAGAMALVGRTREPRSLQTG